MLPATQSVTAAVSKPARQRREPRIQPKVRHACNLIISGECKTIKAAAERAGLSREHLSRMMQMAHVQAFVSRETRKTIAQGTMRASARLIELLDAGSEHVSLDASKHVLAIEGIKPVEAGTNINIINNIQPGYVIDLRSEHDLAAHAPLPASGAKPLIDQHGVPIDDEERR